MQNQPQTTTTTSSTPNILGLLPEVLSVIMGHVGPGSYRYVAGTCKTFRKAIRKEFPNDVQTNGENIVGSKGCAQLYILEAPEKVADQVIYGVVDWRSKSHDVAYWATLNGRVDILEWLKGKGVNLIPQRLYIRGGLGERVIVRAPFDGVGIGGQLGCIPFYVKIGLDLKKNMSLMISHATTNGHLALLKHFHAKGVNVGDRFSMARAARGGYLDVVKFFHQIGCPWDNLTCAAAAENGYLEILKYAHENGCNWVQKYTNSPMCVCSKAAKGGHLECLKYFHQNGGRINAHAAMRAAAGGHLDCLLYLSENGVSVEKVNFAKAVETAMKNGNDSALWYLQGKISNHLFGQVQDIVVYGRK